VNEYFSNTRTKYLKTAFT